MVTIPSDGIYPFLQLSTALYLPRMVKKAVKGDFRFFLLTAFDSLRAGENSRQTFG